MKAFPPFRLDTQNQCLWRRRNGAGEERILLTPKAYAVLVYLVEHAGQLVTHAQLLEAAWAGSIVEAQAVKRNILEVRNALGDHPKQPLFIETVIKRGYRFIAPVKEELDSSTSAPEFGTRSGMVGRDAALSELHRRLQYAASGKRQIVFVTGEAGIGKTALTKEFRRQVATTALSLRIAQGQCVEGYGGKEAYYPMLNALAQLCIGTQGAATIQILAAHAPTWLVQFPALLTREHRETLQREMLGATRERMLREIGETLEIITAEHPLLLVFEDLQWVDPSTVDLISALARRPAAARLMLLATYRPTDLEPRGHPLKVLTQELLVHRLCCEMTLSALTETEVAAYLASQSSENSLPEGLSALLHRHSEGNPLFMIAALDHMTKRGLISRDRGGWQLQVSLSDIELVVPDDLRGMIEAQLDRLSPEEQSMLELSSIVGAAFSAAVVPPIANIDPQRLEDVCEELARRHYIVRWARTRRFPDGTLNEEYEFVHTLYRQVLYDRQPPSRRARVHRGVAERLEGLHSHQSDDVAAELAYHFEASGEWLRAAEYLRRAAIIAARRYAPQQADLLLQRALELVSNVTEEQRWQTEMELLSELGSNRIAQFDLRAIETYQRLIAQAKRHGMIDVEVRALINLSFPLSWTSAEECLTVLNQAQQLSVQQDPVTRLRTQVSCASERLWIAGWSAVDAKACREALANIRSSGDEQSDPIHLIEDSCILWMASEYNEAIRLASQGRAKLVEQGSETFHGIMAYERTLPIMYFSLVFAGRWGEALQELDDARILAVKNGDYYREHYVRALLAGMHLTAHDFAGAQALCELSLPVIREQADPGGVSMLPSFVLRLLLLVGGMAAVTLGQHERGLENLEAANREMDRRTLRLDWFGRLVHTSGLAELWLAKGNPSRARLHGDRYLELALPTQERTWQALAWELNARIALAAGDINRAQTCINNALSVCGFEVPLAAWRSYATAATIEQHAGNVDLATRHRAAGRTGILQLANSLPPEEPLRQSFLSAPLVSRILEEDP